MPEMGVEGLGQKFSMKYKVSKIIEIAESSC